MRVPKGVFSKAVLREGGARGESALAGVGQLCSWIHHLEGKSSRLVYRPIEPVLLDSDEKNELKEV